MNDVSPTAAAPDVLLVGAGPVGLALANDLRRRGIHCRMIDSAPQAVQQTKAVGIQARTLELLAKMGVARTTDRTTRLALTRNPLLLALRDALAPLVFASLPAAAHRLAESLAELNIAYRESPITVDQRENKGALRAGDRAPNALVRTGEGAEPQPLFEIFNSQRSILLVLAGQQDRAAVERQQDETMALLSDGYQEMIEAYLVTRNATSGWDQEVLYDFSSELHQRYEAEQGGLVLVRPDGYIGFWGPFGATEPLRVYVQALFAPASGAHP